MNETLNEEPRYRKTLLTLPDDVVAALAGLDVPTRNAYFTRLVGAGWTYQSIANVTPISRERVRQIVGGAWDANPDVLDSLPVPMPPEFPDTSRKFVEPDPDVLQELLRLKPQAEKVRSGGAEGRRVAERYTRLINEQHVERGVPLYRLAMRLGVTHAALRSRLVRYGYKQAPEGASRAYTPIIDTNRVSE